MKTRTWRKKALFALIPVTALFLFTEAVVRVVGLAGPESAAQVLPVIAHPDEDLFWSHRPNQHMLYMTATVTTNGLGLRGAEIKPKRQDEFRILSLGESTSFGLFVNDDETYAAVLQRQLNDRLETDRFNVINAGIGAYTSFQSLTYLTLRGLDLEPDLVLFYHEYNDYLPTVVRDSMNNPIGLSLTDKQRHDAGHRKLHRKLLGTWATYRFVHLALAKWKIHRFEQAALAQGPGHWRTMTRSGVTMDHPLRVSLAERIDNFNELLDLARERNFKLVIIHPSYRNTIRHECELTDFCRDRQVSMFEAHDSLHPQGVDLSELFVRDDAVHPNAAGHRRIGEALGTFLIENKLVPANP